MVKKPVIVFMGTAPFAVPTLALLLKENYSIAGVVTAPDKPAGRGQKIKYSAVREFAVENQLPVYQPINLKDGFFLKTLAQLKPDLQVVVAFRMLPGEVWSLPPMGTINLHASLLPDYRGAAPINHAIMNGEEKTGVTTFFINEHIDTGPILMQKAVDIGLNENAGDLHDRLMVTGAKLVLNTVEAILRGDALITPQPIVEKSTAALKAAPKIFREDCRINWNRPTREVYNFIRGLSPSPAAFTTLNFVGTPPVMLKVYEAAEVKGPFAAEKPGTCFTDKKEYLDIACNDGLLSLRIIQMEGKKKMPVSDFLRGLKAGELLNAGF